MANIKNFHLNNSLPEPEYMRFNIKNIQQEVIDEYNLKSLVDKDEWIYMKIIKGMYGLKHGGIIAHKELIKHLALYGYHPV